MLFAECVDFFFGQNAISIAVDFMKRRFGGFQIFIKRDTAVSILIAALQDAERRRSGNLERL